MRTANKKLLFLFPLVIAVLAFFALSAFFHRFGPYHGRVVDASTGEPIAGAVILVRFETSTYKEGEIVNRFADAVETMTDQKGDFTLPSHSVFLVRPLHQWVIEAMALVFKPGYGCFPKFKGSAIDGNTLSTLPENERITIRLPPLETLAERKENIPCIYAPGVPDEKMPRLSRMKRIEMDQMAAQPVERPSADAERPRP